jgi:hypothetical protein
VQALHFLIAQSDVEKTKKLKQNQLGRPETTSSVFFMLRDFSHVAEYVGERH